MIILSFYSVYAICNEGQIDINSATKEELENLSGIGPAKAQAIIDSRLFNSVDDLTRVKGIGNKTLENIKSQGLACVSSSYEKEDERKIENTNSSNALFNYSLNNETQKLPELIILKPKTEENASKSSDEKNINYPIYGLIVFSIFIMVLLLLKNRKRKKGLE